MYRIIALGVLAVGLLAGPALAAGQYTHTTTDPNYYSNGEVVLDPYNVGEGLGASHAAILYWGAVNGDTHYTLEVAGWPYTRTRAVLSAAFPCIPDRYCFDHDAAAQLLKNGLTWSALDALYERR